VQPAWKVTESSSNSRKSGAERAKWGSAKEEGKSVRELRAQGVIGSSTHYVPTVDSKNRFKQGGGGDGNSDGAYSVEEDGDSYDEQDDEDREFGEEEENSGDNA